MITKELSEAAVEFNVILAKSSLEIQKRIPEQFKHFLKSIESENYKFEYDNTKTLIEQNLKPETKGIISLVYRDYVCDDNAKKEYIKKCNELKKVLYNPDNLFHKANEIQQEQTQTLIEIKEEKWYKKILGKIKLFLTKKNQK